MLGSESPTIPAWSEYDANLSILEIKIICLFSIAIKIPSFLTELLSVLVIKVVISTTDNQYEVR